MSEVEYSTHCWSLFFGDCCSEGCAWPSGFRHPTNVPLSWFLLESWCLEKSFLPLFSMMCFLPFLQPIWILFKVWNLNISLRKKLIPRKTSLLEMQSYKRLTILYMVFHYYSDNSELYSRTSRQTERWYKSYFLYLYSCTYSSNEIQVQQYGYGSITFLKVKEVLLPLKI